MKIIAGFWLMTFTFLGAMEKKQDRVPVLKELALGRINKALAGGELSYLLPNPDGTDVLDKLGNLSSIFDQRKLPNADCFKKINYTPLIRDELFIKLVPRVGDELWQRIKNEKMSLEEVSKELEKVPLFVKEAITDYLLKEKLHHKNFLYHIKTIANPAGDRINKILALSGSLLLSDYVNKKINFCVENNEITFYEGCKIDASPDGKYMACMENNHLILYRLNNSEKLFEFQMKSCFGEAYAFSHDSKRFAYCDYGRLYLVDIESGTSECVADIPYLIECAYGDNVFIGYDDIFSLSFLPDNQHIMITEKKGKLFKLSVKDNAIVMYKTQESAFAGYYVKVSPSGSYVAKYLSGGVGGAFIRGIATVHVGIHNTQTNNIMYCLDITITDETSCYLNYIKDVFFVDDTRLVVVTADSIMLYDVKTGQCITEYKENKKIASASFDATSKYLYVLYEDKTIQVFSLKPTIEHFMRALGDAYAIAKRDYMKKVVMIGLCLFPLVTIGLHKLYSWL